MLTATTLFCDDIREESNGKLILVGVYLGELTYSPSDPGDYLSLSVLIHCFWGLATFEIAPAVAAEVTYRRMLSGEASKPSDLMLERIDIQVAELEFVDEPTGVHSEQFIVFQVSIPRHEPDGTLIVELIGPDDVRRQIGSLIVSQETDLSEDTELRT